MAQAFSMTQNSVSTNAKDLGAAAGGGNIRKNSAKPLDANVARALGFDLMLNSYILGQKAREGSRILDREKFAEFLRQPHLPGP